MTGHYLNYRQGTIYYRKAGSTGPWLLLLHGLAEDHTIWNNLTHDLAKHCRLLIPDLPGSGRSTVLQPTQANSNIDELAFAVEAILNAEKINQCILIGHSMGGYVALAAAERFPERIEKLGLFQSTAYADTEEKKQMRYKAIRMVEEYGPEAIFRETIANNFTPEWKQNNPELLQQLQGRCHQFSSIAACQYYQMMASRPDRTQVLRQFKGPVLLVAGRKDQAVPINHTLEQCQLPESCWFYILENSAHMGMWEDPGAAVALISAFIS